MALLLKNFRAPQGFILPEAYCTIISVEEIQGGRAGFARVQVFAHEEARRAGGAPLEHFEFTFHKNPSEESWPQAYARLLECPFGDAIPEDDHDIADLDLPDVPDEKALSAGLDDEALDDDDRAQIIGERMAAHEAKRDEVARGNVWRSREREARAERRTTFRAAKIV